MKWMKIREWLLQMHLYLGLFCAPYLLIFGITSLEFNHPSNKKDGKESISQEDIISLQLPFFDQSEPLGKAIQDSLSLMGWYVPWESYQDSQSFKVVIVHAGKKYMFSGEPGVSNINRTITSQPLGSILHGLHGLGEEIPGAPFWINTWQYYQDLTVYALIFWTISGLILWFKRSKKSRISTVYLTLGTIFSLSVMIYLWLLG